MDWRTHRCTHTELHCSKPLPYGQCLTIQHLEIASLEHNAQQHQYFAAKPTVGWCKRSGCMMAIHLTGQVVRRHFWIADASELILGANSFLRAATSI